MKKGVLAVSLPVKISILFYIAFIAYVFYGFFILSYEKKTTIHRVYSLCCFSVAIWAFSFSMANSADSYESCLFWRQAASLGFGTFFSLFLHFILILTNRTKVLRNKLTYIALYLPAIVNIIIFDLYKEIADTVYSLEYYHSGWINVSDLDCFDIYYNVYYLSFTFIGISLLLHWGMKSKNQLEKKEAYTISISYLISVLLGAMTEFIINAFFNIRIPQIAPLIILFPLSTMFFSTKQCGSVLSVTKNRIAPIGTLLSENSKFHLYRYLSVGYLFAGLINFGVIIFSRRESFISNALFSCFIILLGVILYMIQRLSLKLSIKDLLSSFIMTVTVPLFIIKYIEASAIYALVISLIFLLVSIAFNQRRMLYQTGIITIFSLLFLWWKQPSQIVYMSSLDHILRLLVYVVILGFAAYVNHIYLMRLHENEEQIEMKNLLSQISNLFLMADESNIDKKMNQVLYLCNRHFQADRFYIVIFSAKDSHCKKRIYEWCNNGIEPLKEKLEVIDDKQIKEWLVQRRSKSLILNELMNKDQTIGLIGFETLDEKAIVKKHHREIFNLMTHMISSVWNKIETEKENNYRANYDTLTGLVNRGRLLSQLRDEIELARDSGDQIGIIFVDVDSFKSINDTLGHNGGDTLLILIIQRLKKHVRYSDTVARFGGDEFLILLPNLIQEDLKKIANKILNGFKRPIVVNQQSFFVTVSLGLSLYPTDGIQAEELIRFADMAMYQSKINGKNKYTLCSEEMRRQALYQVELTNDLYHALERKEFVLQYQPQVNTKTGELLGVEALIRWHHPIKGCISPGIFIPLVESSGLINNIGEWVLYEACRQCKEWEAQGLPFINMAVNLSLAQFLNPSLVNMVKSILTQTKLNPHILELEITESIATYDKDNILKTMNKLKDLGVSLSIDDFGTEYSSLSRLEQMPIDKIKIDMKFVHGIATGSKDEGIIQVMLQMGQAFGLKVIAEGVENQTQYNFLKDHACDEIQGFFFHKPMPPEEITNLLKLKTPKP